MGFKIKKTLAFRLGFVSPLMAVALVSNPGMFANFWVAVAVSAVVSISSELLMYSLNIKDD